MKFVKDPYCHNKEFPSFSKEEMKKIHFKGKTEDNRFELVTEYDRPVVHSSTTVYFRDKETGKIYGTTAHVGWEKEFLYYGASYEIEVIEKPYIAYKNMDSKGEGYYLDFKRKNNET